MKLTDQIALGAQTRRDLSADETIANQVGLIYTHPCLILALGFEQRFTPDARAGRRDGVPVPDRVQESRRLRDRRLAVRVGIEQGG